MPCRKKIRKVRSEIAKAACFRKAGPMKHKNSPRGGARNVRDELLREEEEEKPPPGGGEKEKK